MQVREQDRRAGYALQLQTAWMKRQIIALQDEHTYVDEIFGYTVALFGVWVQFQWGFGVPFPLNLVMWPFDVLEWYIRWSVTSGMEQA